MCILHSALLQEPQVLCEQRYSAPPKKFEIHNLHAKKLSLTLDMRGFPPILFSGAPQPLKGWETLT